MRRLCAVVFLFLAGLHGPAFAQPGRSAPAEEVLANAVKFYPDVWQTREDGQIRHLTSGFSCSTQLGNTSIAQVVTVPDGVLCLWMGGAGLRMVTGAKQAEFRESLEDVGRKAVSVLTGVEANPDDPVINYEINGCPAVHVVGTRDSWKADLILAQKGSYYWISAASVYGKGEEADRKMAEAIIVRDAQFKSEISCKASG